MMTEQRRSRRCLIIAALCLLVALPPTASIEWLRVVRHVRATLRVLNKIKNSLTVDLSSGQGDISSPDGQPVHVSAILHNRERSVSSASSSSTSFLPAADAALLASGIEVVPSRSTSAAANGDGDDSTLLWVHQVGKRVVRKVPDTALLGVLVLVAAELLRRGVNTNRDTMPPLLRDFAEKTITELDTKLEQLSSLEWQVTRRVRCTVDTHPTNTLTSAPVSYPGTRRWTRSSRQSWRTCKRSHWRSSISLSSRRSCPASTRNSHRFCLST